MSPYLIVLILLVTAAFAEGVKALTYPVREIIYHTLFVLLILFVCLRYGQGTDYNHYEDIYYSIPKLSEITKSQIMSLGVNGDFGWTILNAAFQQFGLEFYQVSAILAIIEMLLIYRYIAIYCNEYKLVSLLMMYHTLYLSYIFSSMRAALVICLFLGVILKQIEEKKYFLAIIGIVIISTLHIEGLVLLILVFVYVYNKYFLNKIIPVVVCVIFWTLGFLPVIPPVRDILVSHLPWRITYYMNGGIQSSFFPVMFQLVVACAVIYLYNVAISKETAELKLNRLTFIYNSYLIGLSFYGLFLTIPFIAAKLSYLLTVLHIGLICELVDYTEEDSRRIIILCIIGICILMTVKNIQSYIQQGSYDVRIFDYPYMSWWGNENIINRQLP